MKYPVFHSIGLPTVSDTNDNLYWRHNNGDLLPCSAARVWESIRPSGISVSWFAVDWFSQCVPRHAFLLWLVMGERLKTQDRLKPWETHSSMLLLCPLCKACGDSHDHLFFGCSYALEVWSRARQFLDIPMPNCWKGVVHLLSPMASRNSVNIVVAKIMFAASIYFIWQERNNRIFKKSHRTEVKLFEDIYATVILKLLSINFKSSPKVVHMKE
ncbi:uncharacterized protein [Rutidosis leptorrhynchoides]|uniref:uncharacterized protein n=1 Tax=Rutidosis leptorrhynchoides TaxID=125765 RepID=UPI003A9935B5